MRRNCNTVDFAASNREANYIACYLGYGLSILGLLNTMVVFRSQRVAVISLGALITLFPVLYFLSGKIERLPWDTRVLQF